MASIQTKTLNALMPNTNYVTHGEISSAEDLTTVIEFVTGEDSAGTAITQAWDESNDDYSPFTYAEYTAKYTEIENAEPMRLLRVERDRRLAETDWMAGSDLTMSSAWTTYRQALRDVPAQEGITGLDDVTWPTKPD